jgi:hypothetical protein
MYRERERERERESRESTHYRGKEYRHHFITRGR